MKNMPVTVVIPAFNEEKYIEKTLKSLKDQTVKDFNIIVVNNNSTDQTASIAASYGAKVILEQKQGYVYALNSGMFKADGNIILVTDADSQPFKNWVEKALEVMSNDRIVAITGPANITTHSPFFNMICKQFYSAFLRLNFFFNKPHISGFNFAVRKSAFQKVGGLDTSFTMSPDVDLGLRLHTIGKVKFIPEFEVTTSMRRWEKNPFLALVQYTKGYVYSVWIRKPSPVSQSVIR